MDSILILAILGLIVALLVSERVRPDVVAVLCVALLMLLGIVPVREALAGFSSPATITVACMFLLSAGLQNSGLVRFIGDRVLQHGPGNEAALLLLIGALIAPLSAFVNNTAAVAVFLPVVLRVCHGRGVSPSRLLMPMAFIAILGGTCTLIGTSTNILVTSMAAARGLRPFRMFEFSHLGLIFLAIGAVYLVLVGRRLLPRRVEPETLTAGYRLDPYLAEVLVPEDSPLLGQSLVQARLAERFDIEVLALVRGSGRVRAATDENLRLREDDTLLVKASAANLVRLEDTGELVVRTDREASDAAIHSSGSVLLEAIVYPASSLVGRTIHGIDFRHRFGATVVALRRHGSEILDKLGNVRLRGGDELLIVADRRRLDRLRGRTDFVVLQEIDVDYLQPVRAAVAGLILVAVVVLAAVGIYPIVFSAFLGCCLMILTGCLPVRVIHGAVDWKVIVLLAGVIPLGTALETTGAADQLVRAMLWAAGPDSPRLVLLLFVVATYSLTGFMSNNATAAVMVPLAISSAAALGVDSRPFLIAIMFAASAAFYTPVGYQTNLLVYGPGGYRFADYLRVGGPLNLLYALLSTLLIPLLFRF